MTRTALIVGTGPAAAGAALALLDAGDIAITVLDIGGRLEAPNREARERLASVNRSSWRPEDLALVSRLPQSTDVVGLPEKRTYGSDFPFRDLGQLGGIVAEGGVNNALASSAFGGFSNVWGAQVMPFPAAAFSDWPFSAGELTPHYRTILREIPYAGEYDDLASRFPLLAEASALPRLSPRSEHVLLRYSRHRRRLNRLGLTVGRARLAMNASECIRCGLCMTGCPYGLIYSAADTWSRLVRDPRVTYIDKQLALSLAESADAATVQTRDLETGRLGEFSADRVFVGCGSIGTSRLVMGSLRLFDEAATVQESAQFVLPFLSSVPVPDPRTVPHFTLNQFNMAVALDDSGYALSHLHFYTFDQSFLLALPRMFRRSQLRGLQSLVLRHISVALGYVPSWAAPTFRLSVSPAARGQLPQAILTPSSARPESSRFMRRVMTRLARGAPLLDCVPIVPAISFAAPGKSYHFGGTFPHATRSQTRFSSDVLGRVLPWERIHLVDASVFPSIAATTFTLTIMANAHRIAESSLQSLVW